MSAAPAPSHEPGLVTIVLPAKNEEAAIGKTLRSLPRATLEAMGFRVEVIILDGQSRDRTRDVVYRHGGATVVFDRKRGKGRAFVDGLRHVRGEYVIMLDADGTYPPDLIPRFVTILARNDADVVMGDRIPAPGSMSGLHQIGNAVLSLLARTLYAKPCKDLCTGMWGFRAGALFRLPLRSRHFELEAEMFALAVRKKLRIAHVPIDYLPREGESKIRTADALRIGLCLARSRVIELPNASLHATLARSMSSRTASEAQA